MNSTRILIIDDDNQFQKLMELRLKSMLSTVEISKCSSLKEAREFLNAPASEPIDLVVLDQHLSDGAGTKLLDEQILEGMAVLAVSSDEAPEMAGASMAAGATYFLTKSRIGEPLLKPLILGLIERNRLQRQLSNFRTQATVVETVRTLVGTLRHEINNPLGAVLGAAFILRAQDNASSQAKEAARLVEESGKRIKHVLDELTQAVSLETVTKANHKVFHVPGDKPWGENT